MSKLSNKLVVFDTIPGLTTLYRELEDYNTVNCYHFENLKQLLAHSHLQADLVFFDAQLGYDICIELLTELQNISPASQIIFIDPNPKLEEVVNLLKMGAENYWKRPKDLHQKIFDSINQQLSLLENKDSFKADQLVDKFRNLGMLGNSKLSKRVYKKIEKAAKTKSNILIYGESGTGKNTISKLIHQLSKQSKQAYQIVDIAEIPSELMITSLFGQEKNVFEGVLNRKIGLIEQANGGYLILKNLHELPLNIQNRLIRTFEERKFIRPGGNNIVFFSARIIVLSEVNLEIMTKKKTFLKSLFYYIQSLIIESIPLRKRTQDILVLSNYFLRQFIRENQLKNITLSQEAKDKLLEHSYLGNVRELKTIIETAATICIDLIITAEDIIIQNGKILPLENWLEEKLTMQEIIQKSIDYYLDQYNGNVLDVAKQLNIGKSTIYRHLKNSTH